MEHKLHIATGPAPPPQMKIFVYMSAQNIKILKCVLYLLVHWLMPDQIYMTQLVTYSSLYFQSSIKNITL